MLHCGYHVNIEPIIPELRKYIGENIRLKICDLYTAVHYANGQQMLTWFTTRSKVSTGQITGVYFTKKDAVCILSVDGRSLYLTIAHNSDTTAINMKRRANCGEMGKLVPTGKLSVVCTPVYYHNVKKRYYSQDGNEFVV